MKKNKYSLTIFILFLAFQSAAQNGPQVPCLDCEKYSQRTLPKEGLWYNPDESGSGFNIEVQNGILLGTYYGYDADGKPLWHLFTGTLSPSEELNVMWELEADLQSFENGQCLNCAYQSPTAIDNQSSIAIKFHQKGSASFQVNDGEVTYLSPFIYGVAATSLFAPASSYKFPDLRGRWVMTFDRTSLNGIVPNSVGETISYALDIFDQIITNNAEKIEASYFVKFNFNPFDDFDILVAIDCVALKTESGLTTPECVFHLPIEGFGPRLYTFPIGNVTENRIYGETTIGETFEAVRTHYEEE